MKNYEGFPIDMAGDSEVDDYGQPLIYQMKFY